MCLRCYHSQPLRCLTQDLQRQKYGFQIPVDQLVEQQALIEVLELALPHPAAPLQLHVAVHSGVIGPSALLAPVIPLRCSVERFKRFVYFRYLLDFFFLNA